MPDSLQRFAGPEWLDIHAPASAFYRIKYEEGYSTRLRNSVSSLHIKADLPNRIIEVEDAFILPGKPTVWTRDGQRIAESCVRRGLDLSQYIWAGPETVVVPEDCDVVDETMIYLSFLPNEWGHFLLEGTSRLWAVQSSGEFADMKCFYGYSDFRNPNFSKYFEYAQIDMQRLTQFRRPTMIKKCLVPEASFSIRAEAYMRHAEISQKAARRILHDSPWAFSAQPVYLSRSKIKRGRIIRNEVELEDCLRAAGIKIVHPEELSLEEQITLFNSHTDFIGCWGSAFHNLLFALNPQRITTHVMCEDVPNQNYTLIDSILKNKANYVQALFYSPGVQQKYPNMDSFINVELMTGYLRDQKLIG